MSLEVTRPVLRYFGGKFLLAPWIIQNMPSHEVYVEPFGGGGSVLLQKKPSRVEVYNDLAGEVVNVFRVLRSESGSARLRELLRLTPFARDEFNDAYEETDCLIERARRTIIRSIMGSGGRGHNINTRTGFKADSFAMGTPVQAQWADYHKHVEAFHARLAQVIIENRDAKEVMQQQDRPEALHFVDPPYVIESRGAKSVYHFEMTDKEHEDLCDFLASLSGMVMLCGYENPIYRRLGWRKLERHTKADKGERVECLWLNPAAAANAKQPELFA